MDRYTIKAQRAQRSTRAELADAETHHYAVMAALLASGDDYLADRLQRCQRARQHRGMGFPWRCRSPGCWSCRRTVFLSWWRGMREWSDGTTTSLAIIPIDGDRLNAIRKVRKGLRDLRDRTARERRQWREVAFAGLLSGDQAMVLVQHAGVSLDELWSILERRWSDAVVTDDVGNAEPSWRMSVDDTAALARRQRGVEPMRIIVLAQM